LIRRAFAAVTGAALLAACSPALAEEPVRTPAAALQAKESGRTSTAIFAGGCFWGVEGVFSHVDGVKSAVSGYHGGSPATANYTQVSAGSTRHAEAVKVTYDPTVVRYDELLRIYFAVVADPTQLNRQGPDRGPQYRSALAPLNAEQAKVARAYIAQLGKAKLWDRPIVTKIEKAGRFHSAEDYHQDYLAKNPRAAYIQRWDMPKLRALKAYFPDHYRTSYQRG